jgi:hypothetical protein
MRHTHTKALLPHFPDSPLLPHFTLAPWAAAGRLPDALKPGFHCVGTHWIRGFIAFEPARHTQTMLLMVPV